MDMLLHGLGVFITQLQSPALAFLIAGALLAAFKSKLQIPTQVYDFAVFMLLMKIGLSAGLVIRETSFLDMLLPIILSMVIGVSIVLVGLFTLARLPGVKKDDALATLGLFGAVSGSTLVAAMFFLEEENIPFEAWIPALYPFMDIPALVTAIILARLYKAKKDKEEKALRIASGEIIEETKKSGRSNVKEVKVVDVIKESLAGSALSALLLGIALGLFTNPQSVLESFYDPLFRGLLSVIMLVLGMEAYLRLKELAKVAHWYTIFAILGPITHGLIGFGLGYIAYMFVGLSPGGVILIAILAASSSDVSGPPTIRAAIPTANPSAYIGASTGIGTVVSIAICIPLFTALAKVVFNL